MGILLNPKHEKVAMALARGAGVCDAYVSAGFKRNPASASKLCAKPEIRSRVAELVEFRNKLSIQNEIITSRDIAAKLGITKEKILKSVWDVAQACLKGAPILDKNGEPTGKYTGKVDAVGASRALELVGRESYSMFVEKHEVGEAGAFARLTDEELTQKLAEQAEALGFDAEATEAFLTMLKGDGVKH
jgi:hypothetical protein